MFTSVYNCQGITTRSSGDCGKLKTVCSVESNYLLFKFRILWPYSSCRLKGPGELRSFFFFFSPKKTCFPVTIAAKQTISKPSGIK